MDKVESEELDFSEDMTDDDLRLLDADEVMLHACEHYLKHHDVVFKKLLHTQEATLQSLQEIKDLCKKLDERTRSEEIARVKKYDDMWGQIIGLFRDAGVSEEELGKIETVLSSIPESIDKFYRVLLEKDIALLALMAELESDHYKRALSIVRKVQSRPDPLSGLPASEYDVNHAAPERNEVISPRAYKIFHEMPAHATRH